MLFIEGVPMRAVTGGDAFELRRIATKLGQGMRLRTVERHLHVLRPPPVPPVGRVGRRAQLLAIRAAIAYARHRLKLGGAAVSWFSLPTMAPLRGRLGEQGSLLYYQDRYDAFSHVDAPWLRECLRELVQGCQVAVASAEELGGDLRKLGADPVIVPHGVDVERFAGNPRPPKDLDGLERPLVGYVGIVDDYLDLTCLTSVADALTEGTVVVVGAANTDVRMLREHPRITLLGRRPYGDIPGYLAAFDCCLIPFSVTPLTVAVNPIKLREYLAAGRPVVSTPLPEVLPYGDVVSVAEPGPAFVEAVLAAIDADDDAGARRARVAAESWDAVAARIEPLLRTLLRSE